MAPRTERNRENQTGRIFASLQLKNKDLVCGPHFSSDFLQNLYKQDFINPQEHCCETLDHCNYPKFIDEETKALSAGLSSPYQQ